MFKEVVIMRDKEIVRAASWLDISNGKFLAIIVCMLVMFVTVYTKSIDDGLTDLIKEVKHELEKSDVALRKDIAHLTTSQSKVVADYRENRREIDEMQLIKQFNIPVFDSSIQSAREELMRKVLNEYTNEGE